MGCPQAGWNGVCGQTPEHRIHRTLWTADGTNPVEEMRKKVDFSLPFLLSELGILRNNSVTELLLSFSNYLKSKEQLSDHLPVFHEMGADAAAASFQ